VDATTVAQVKAGLRGWRLGQALFVGDAGMDSEANRPEWATGLGHSLRASPMGQLTAVPQAGVSRAGRCRQGHDHLAVKAVVVGEGARRRRDSVCHNLEEAARQRQHRAEVLGALRQALDRLEPQAPAHTKRACELVASPRDGRSLRRGPGGQLAIDREAVERATRLDGQDVLLTTDESLRPEDVGLG
jgi:hypothetical protein